MSQYSIFDGEKWIDAAVVGPKGDIGPYYKPYLDEDGNFSMESSDDSQERIELGNITGPTGLTGYGYNANLFDNADFTYPLIHANTANTYLCERWYKNSTTNLTATFLTNNGGLKLQSDDRSYINQYFPYIAPGTYIVSVVCDKTDGQNFVFRVVDKDDGVVSVESQTTFDNNLNKIIHYGILKVENRLLSEGAKYPCFQIGNKGESIIYRAKLETIAYREGENGETENPSPTIQQDIMVNQSYSRLATISSDMNGNYLSPFRANTISIEKSKWSLNSSDGMYYADAPAITDAVGSCHVIIAAEPDSAAEFADYSIVCSDHNTSTGVLTYRAAGIPDKTISSNVLVVRY